MLMMYLYWIHLKPRYRHGGRINHNRNKNITGKIHKKSIVLFFPLNSDSSSFNMSLQRNIRETNYAHHFVGAVVSDI